mgnify:CR=1 FL=1
MKKETRPKFIFHIDVNSAFLSWSALEQLKEDPQSVDLRRIPSAVAGDVNNRHGIITAKSIPAKAYGIQTAEPVVSALEKCPQLVLVKGDFLAYRRYSDAFISLLREYSPILQQLSIDEAFLDVTARCSGKGECGRQQAIALAHEMRKQIYDNLGFTVNVGIAQNKLLAKMASDFTKPDRVHTLFPEELNEKFLPLPIEELYGCGPSTAKRLRTLGLCTIGEVAECSLEILQSHLGKKAGQYIYESTHGIGSDVVQTEKRKAKSYSNETTTPVNVTGDNYDSMGMPIVEKLAAQVSTRLQRDGVVAKTIFVQVKTREFQRYSRQTTLLRGINRAEEMAHVAKMLLDELLLGPEGLFARGEQIRLLGVGGSHLDDGKYNQLTLWDLADAQKEYQEERQKEQKQQKAENMMEKIRQRFGDDAISKGQS